MRSTLLFIVLVSVCRASAQDTLSSKLLDEVVITATRTEHRLGNVAIPTQLVSKRIIQLSGSLRLNEVLQEQSGLFITSGSGSGAVGGGIFGNGIQMQGLSPDHTMILLDGEPLIGRQGGVMDLSRFAIGNIKKIEIVKGPSSSLYGSEAMGGVINIITEPLQGKQMTAGIRSGSFFTTDLYASGNYTGKKAAFYFFANRNSSRGYELDHSTPEKTLDPFFNYTGHFKFSYRFSPKTKLVLNNRYFYSLQESFYAINSARINVGGNGQTNDLNLNPVLTHKFNSKVSSQMRFLLSAFRFTQQLDSLANQKRYYADDFRQGFYRAENQTDIELNNNNTLTFGGGYTLQTVNTTRYREMKQQHLYYAFAQNEWQAFNQLVLIGGLRYDYNTAFKARISPKLAVNYKLNDKIKINASYGAGFKAPDFRQLYLSFINNAADGYSIYGANEFSITQLERQKQEGLVAQILAPAYQITTLNPEISRGINLGVQLNHWQKWKADINLFRNDIDNLINYIPVATNANGTSVFSYVNINRAYTQGIELNIQYQVLAKLAISGGYQYLETADKNILHNILNAQVFGRDMVGGSARLMGKADYSGLLNRSKHMANLRLFFDDVKSGWSASLRFIYRSRFGVLDKDGNGFANMREEFAQAMLQVNTTASRQLNKRFNVQVGINNLLNQTNARFMPNLPGRNFFLAIHYTVKK